MGSLIRAAECGHTAVAMLLLDVADREAEYQALVAACGNGHAETARRLLEAINCDEPDPSWVHALKDAFLCAAYGGHLEAVQVLLEGRAALVKNFCDNALVDASSRGHGEVVQFLLGHGACKDVLGQSGLRALMYAAANGYSEVAQLLLGHGACKDALAPSGLTAPDVRSCQWPPGRGAVLVDVGADTSVQDSYGRTALLLASGASKTVKLSNGRAVLVSNPATPRACDYCWKLALTRINGTDRDAPRSSRHLWGIMRDCPVASGS